MRRPCLSCLPALLLLVMGCMASCIQTSDGLERPAPGPQLLSAEGLSFPVAITNLDRGTPLPAGPFVASAAVAWPHNLCCGSVAAPHCESALPRSTDFRGMLPLPAPPPRFL
ncbi:MAG TPA: hypothetical protein IAB01_08290 [Candidatus Avidesulfovibrio excrementigallinarum]|nr:hypothetical protein [Candidatus Avidesulfovibrio excrementigallinarum]